MWRRPPDFPLLLPEAPRMVILDPPRLFAAIYGTPGGAHAPAICGLLMGTRRCKRSEVCSRSSPACTRTRY